ncbi:HesA/MoeB/ThiF family protein [Rhodoferax aquaticus]|uniref:HesA/MoeB/ThiF family protein n=1 Tax=Rhodoferax aquaticus TaxID=2527691 RepID=A0A515EM55_9BURK|nr:HesA/MoeB/ThiF family protein [Rhodoferax aquaticus]QDL53753.1 HesA/MoeB/ThiF family protein [Rhodoferax aquaticus]
MQDDELLRYSRHILLNEIGIEGQERILASHALVIGAGGLGSPAAMYLACAGVGTITLVDHDTVDLTNLQRQIAHHTASVGTSKVSSAHACLSALNPNTMVRTHTQRADTTLLDALVPQADVVLDCCDNFTTRQAINEACVKHKIPLVSGAAVQFDGQITTFDARNERSPCYACIYPQDTPPEEAQCATMGVFAPLVGIVGATQAAEALKVITRVGDLLSGKLLMLNAKHMEWHALHIPRNRMCEVCG